MLSPSSRNTQPWAFVIASDEIAARADRTRALAVNDPHDRELTMSCACALLTLRVAARAAGLDPEVRALPDPADPDPADGRAARRGRPGRPAGGGARRGDPASADVQGAVAEDEVAPELVAAEGDRAQFADAPGAASWPRWMRPRRRGDGLVAPMAARLVVGALDLGGRTASKDARLAGEAPAVAVLATDGDAAAD